jgi:hypothetical protein
VSSKKPLLIGLTGNRGSGKDTSFGFIEKWAAEKKVLATRRAFADPLKFSFSRIFRPEITLEEAVAWCDELKLNSSVYVQEQDHTVTQVSGRMALQHHGYEGHREIFGDNFWIEQLLPVASWPGKFDGADICVVTDVRLNNEAERIKELGGFVWKIERNLDTFDQHISEGGVSDSLVDILFMNIDLENLEIQVRSQIKKTYEEKK